VIDRIEAHKRRIIKALILANWGFVAFVMVWAYYVEGDSWRRIVVMFDSEGTPIAWFSSVQLLLVGLVAYGTHVVTRLRDHQLGRITRYRWVWPFLASGFVLLSLDEFFMFHEQLRERIMKPHDLLTSVPGFKPGDIGLFIYLAVGFGVAYFLVQALRPNKTAVRLFFAAIAVITPLVILDAFHVGILWDNLYVRRLYLVTEEVGENIAELLFLLSFVLVFFDRLLELVGGSPRE
jgi:hypothetical protein